MPEDVPFNCRVCCPERPSPWETVVQQEMYNGMTDVLDALLSSHSSMLLQPVPQPVSSVSHRISFCSWLYLISSKYKLLSKIISKARVSGK